MSEEGLDSFEEQEDELVQDFDNLPPNLSPEIEAMFSHKTKLSSPTHQKRINDYKETYIYLKHLQHKGELPVHQNYLCDSELATDIYKQKYYLKDLNGNSIEKTPEDVFVRLASYIAALEPDTESQKKYAKRFYNILYNGLFMPGGRVIAGAGDLYRIKTLANCFVTKIEKDNIESIYKAAYECARTYSYGGGIGVDLSCLRPREAVVHNAANKSTGAVSFAEVYSMTTGLIGQAGRRGALMLTLDIKHPDIFHFIDMKHRPNWVTNQVVQQCRFSGKFSEDQIKEVEKQVMENTQVRFANISIKVTDEFMQAVSEQKSYNNRLLVYKKFNKGHVEESRQGGDIHYSYSIPSKDISNYSLYHDFDSIEKLNEFLSDNHETIVAKEELLNPENRDVFGDYVIPLSGEKFDLAIKFAGDFMLFFGSEASGDVRRLVKASDIWSKFVASNYKTAEPGLIFWSNMSKYSPSNYVGRPITCTNPCGEVPLEDGGACNLASINLSRCVIDGFTSDARIDWKLIKNAATDLVRFLDNVITWNEELNPLDKQRKAASETRRIGIGYMGIADLFDQLGISYDSKEGMVLIGKVAKFIANTSYQASAMLAAEKGQSPVFNYEDYCQNPFFIESLDDETKEMIKANGLRNVALLSIAPTGTISNVVLSFKIEDKNYIGVSGGIEPIFSLFYKRRSESFGNKVFKIFHSTIQAYIDKYNLQDKVDAANSLEELENVLPLYFFSTAHTIEPDQRIEIQSICQKYIDHSISSTVNLPESVDPETISDIYLQAWRKGLKGVTIYRDGSRFAILSIDQKQNEFSTAKDKIYKVVEVLKEKIVRGDDVIIAPDGKLTTPFHALQNPHKNLMIQEVKIEEPHKHDPSQAGAGACKIEIIDGKLIKSCGD